MRSPSDILTEQFKELLALGDKAGKRRFGTGLSAGLEAMQAGGRRVDPRSFSEWRAASLSALERVFGESHVHTRSFAQCQTAIFPQVQIGQGILTAALRDIENGYLDSLRRLVLAEVFTTTIDQAKALFESGHLIPAAVLARIVIEGWLKCEAEKAGVAVSEDAKASNINDSLKKAGIFSVPKWRQVQVYLDIGNAAAHGKAEKFTRKELEGLLAFAEANYA